MARSTVSMILRALPVAAVAAAAMASAAHADEAADRALAELARNDVVWRSPGLDAAGSMPIGNGRLGANAWIESNGDIVLLLSHTDAFSEAERLLKLGRVRISCDPPLALSPFTQRMSFVDGAIEVECGAGDQAARARVFVDAGCDVLHAVIEGNTPRKATARLELWRTEKRRLQGAELASSWVMRGAPDSVVVEESADIVLDAEQAPESVAWYHRNADSIVSATLAHQGLAEFEPDFRDPLTMRTFGCWMRGEGFARVSDRELATAAPSTHVALRIAAQCSVFDDLDEWLGQLAHLARINGDDARAARETRDWWSDRFTRSWAFVDAPRPCVLDNRHPLRAGFDSNGQNRFEGEIRGLRLSAGAAGDAISLAHAGDAREIGAGFAPDGSFTVEATIAPAHAGATARIADKLTAGGSDGFLLDLQGGALRAIVGGTALQTAARPRAGADSRVRMQVDAAAQLLTVWLDDAKVGEAPIAAPRGASLSQAYAAQRAVALAATDGRFPVKFNGSIFTVAPRFVNGAPFNDDFRNWGGDYWWQNTRLPYHGMAARGDGDRMQSLFRFYAGVLRGCATRAREYYGAQGAYFPETMTTFGTYGNGDYGWSREGVARNVVQCPYWQWAWNQGPELVALMLDHWDHTGDAKTLLRETLPVAREVLAYFDSRFARDARGRLVIDPTQAVETYWSGVVNDTPTVAGLREVTARLCALPADFGSADERALWQRMRAACPDLPLTADGARLAPAERFAPQRSNCENPELYAVWPFRLDDALLEAGRRSYAARIERMTHGWTQDGMQAARLGLADDAAANVLAKLANTNPAFRYPAFWGPNFDWLPDQCHGSNLLTTVQEMLLQADGARIRVLPAWPKAWNARFRLHAPQATVVTGEVRGGRLVSLEVQPAARAKDVVLGEGW